MAWWLLRLGLAGANVEMGHSDPFWNVRDSAGRAGSVLVRQSAQAQSPRTVIWALSHDQLDSPPAGDPGTGLSYSAFVDEVSRS